MNSDPVLTVKQAALWFHRSESTIWDWISLGYLSAVGQRGRAKLYRFVDLVEVERAARHHANPKNLGDSSPDLR